MAITFDTKLDIAESGTTPVTANYTCGANAKLLTLCIANDTNTIRTGGAPTYNGVALTLGSPDQVDFGEGTSEVWYLQNPPVSSSLEISVPNTESGGNNNCTVMVISFDAASGYAIVYDKGAQNNATSSNPTVSVTPTNSNSLIVNSMFSGDGTTPSANSDVLVYQHDTGQEGNGSQYKLNAGISSHDLTWTIPSDDWNMNVAVFYEQQVVIEITTCPNWTNTETGIVCDGQLFGASKGSGKIEMGDNATYGSANLVEQTTTAWGDTQITFDGSLGAQSAGSKWMYVTNTSAEVSAAFAVTVSANTPVVTDVETTNEFSDKDTNITVTGTYFDATQGTGKVELGDNSDYATANKIEQTETSWNDTTINITVDLDSQSPGSKWIFVTNDDDFKNDPGFAVTVHRAEAFQMSVSDDIAASGEITTFQLTAPATKSTTDFVTGRLQEDENPADTIDIPTDDYTEVEWCFIAKTNAREVQYDFRVTVAGTALDSYNVTPKLTIIVDAAGRQRIMMVI